MAKYKCKICGHIYDEEKEGILFKDLPDDWVCPKCKVPKVMFEKIEEKNNLKEETVEKITSLENYLKEYERNEEPLEPYMKDIHAMALTGNSIIDAMGSKKNNVSWDDILILGNQLNPRPLSYDERIITKTIIGKKAKKPMILETPIYISHMSFGALSKEMKIAMAKASNIVKTATCSGEGGIIEEELENAYQYIFEYVPNLYSVTDENLKRVSAIEIKIGQSAKPGLGGHLPGNKVTKEIAQIRNKIEGKDVISPSRFENIVTKEDLKDLVDKLREKSEGRPIGIKIAANKLEQDLEYIAYANPDFITIDGHGGGTGASPKYVKDSCSIPTIYALYRTRKYLDEHQLDIDLVITGGLRIGSDFAKALAMGADAIAVATPVMIAAGCQQYRICGSGNCPVGIATQDSELRKRFDIDASSQRISNYLLASTEDIKTFSKMTGHKYAKDLSIDDLATINMDISTYTNIKHV